LTDAETLEWLLEPGEPWIRYNALVDLLDAPRSSGEVREALAESMATPPISRIIAGLDAEGRYSNSAAVAKWGASAVEAGYKPGYKGGAWKLLFLAQVGADPEDGKVRKLGENILANAYSEEQGTFCVSFHGGPQYMMPCFMGNMIWALSRLGLGSRPEVVSALNWLVMYQRFDDGDWKPPTDFPYRGARERCWGRHTCYWGVTNLLRAMTVAPSGFLSHEAEEVKRRGIDFVLAHRLLWSSHNPTRPIATKNTRPQRLTAPLTYYHDAVEIATTMLKLGVGDGAVDDTIEFVLSKRNEAWRWVLDNAPGNVDTPFGLKGRESKWITFRALRMLKLGGRFKPN
jgi:hypothetical protein